MSYTALYTESHTLVTRLGDVRTPSPPTKPIQTVQSSTDTIAPRGRLETPPEVEMALPSSHERIVQQESYIKSEQESNKIHVRRDKKQTPAPSGKDRKPVKVKSPKRFNYEQACIAIQRAWRRHIDIQVYKYYRDLINFKQKGDPALMLRCINPNEAKLLDAATGVHIKFRLAGDKFPPNIYYKIFTHRPVQDLCANSPKDYTKADSKRPEAKQIHNKGLPLPSRDKCGWYERIENNGWRLVSDRLLHHMTPDQITKTTAQKKVSFHHNKLQRKQDLEKKKKEKKLDWLKKMYREGMVRAVASDPETVALVEGAAAGLLATVQAQGVDTVQDWEVDELLDWTTALNFDDYLTDWRSVGTTNFSDKAKGDRLQVKRTSSDPYELMIDRGLGRDKEVSALRSFNTPASSVSYMMH